MTRLALQLSIPAVASFKGGGGGAVAGGAAGAMLASETNGLAFNASDDSMVIKDTVTPANNYVGTATVKFGSIRASGGLQYGSTGLLEWGPANLTANSNGFSTGTWAKDNCTVAQNATGIDGATSAWTMTDNATNAEHRIYSTITPTTGTLSIYAKAGTAGFISLSNMGAGQYVVFNLTTGVIATATTGWVGTITAAANGFFRCEATNYGTGSPIGQYCIFNMGRTAAEAMAGATYAGTGSTIIICNAQFNYGTTAQAYLPTTGSAFYGLRRDYDPRAAGAKYLFEEARTNTFLWSQDFDIASWTKTAVTVAANNTTAPDGTLTADKLTATAADSTLVQTTGVTPSTQYTYSIYLKADAPTTIKIYALGGTPSNISCDVTTSWQRFSITFTEGAGSSDTFYIGGGGSFSTGEIVYAWGAQLELGAFASSYIPTFTATVTRAADNPIMAITAFNFHATTNSIYLKYSIPVHAGEQYFTSAYDIGLFDMKTVAGRPTVQVSPGGYSLQAVLTPAVGSINKFAYARGATGDLSFSTNGAAVITTPGTGTPAPVTTHIKFGKDTYATTTYLNGWMYELKHVPRRMPDAELVTVTT